MSSYWLDFITHSSLCVDRRILPSKWSRYHIVLLKSSDMKSIDQFRKRPMLLRLSTYLTIPSSTINFIMLPLRNDDKIFTIATAPLNILNGKYIGLMKFLAQRSELQTEKSFDVSDASRPWTKSKGLRLLNFWASKDLTQSFVGSRHDS